MTREAALKAWKTRRSRGSTRQIGNVCLVFCPPIPAADLCRILRQTDGLTTNVLLLAELCSTLAPGVAYQAVWRDLLNNPSGIPL